MNEQVPIVPPSVSAHVIPLTCSLESFLPFKAQFRAASSKKPSQTASSAHSLQPFLKAFILQPCT